MEIKVNKKMNAETTAQFTIDERDAKTALVMLAFLSEPMECYLEGFKGNPVSLTARKAKGKEGTDKAGQTFTYIQRRVRANDGRWATSQMGEYQDGGFYWKKWEIYDPNAADGQPTQTNSQPQGQVEYPTESINPDDIPF